MTRVKNGVATKARHKKILKQELMQLAVKMKLVILDL